MDNLSEMLKGKGYKATEPRLAILRIFAKSRMPLDAEAVYKKILKMKNSKNTNRTTVYRSLESFEASGILKKVDLRRDSTYFEFADSHHHHIVCLGCERVEDFTNSEIEKILRRIVEKSPRLKEGFKNITEHSLELFGLCVKCS